jgi:hypothetical protein
MVVRGFSQKYGIDYNETFAPVLGMPTFLLMLHIAKAEKLEIWHLDVKTAFQYGEVDEDIFIMPPRDVKVKEGKVWKLKKALYGLKQAARQWHLKLRDQLIRKGGYQYLCSDECLYVKMESKGVSAFIGVFVDDIVVIGKPESLAFIKEILSEQFDINELGPLTWYLGMRLLKQDGIWSLDQEQYTDNMLKKYQMEDCKALATPMVENFDEEDEAIRSDQNQGETVQNEEYPYQAAIGSLLYLALMTRPDICYAVIRLARYTTSYTRKHILGVKRIFRYLQGTKKLGLTIEGEGYQPTVYVDASWGDRPEAKSVSGYSLYIGNTLMSWRSKKQSCVSLSTMEAEFVASALGVQELLWCRKILEELQLWKGTGIVRCDNQACNAFVKDARYRGRAKHINIKYFFCKESSREE